MLAAENQISVGIDLGREYTQITFCSKNSAEPLAVVCNGKQGGRSSLIPTPEQLFSLVERKNTESTEVLYQFFTECFAQMKTAGTPEHMTVMVTMHEMKAVWAETIREALKKIGVPDSGIFLQSHRESFFAYVMNQKKEFYMYHTALVEYHNDSITAWHLWLDKKTKPVLAKTEKCFRLYLDQKARKGRGDEEWDLLRDALLQKHLEEMFESAPFSAIYLVGSEFEKKWMQKSLHFLGRKRHVFVGQNLYTRGACYAAMEENGAGAWKGILYTGEDMVRHNIGMWMKIRGEEGYYPIVNAGINWYMARHTCEFLLQEGKKLTICARSIQGEEMEYTWNMEQLPDRPKRATRIRLTVSFTAPDRCKVRAEDLGLGELYPSSGKVWEATISLS